MPEEEKKEQIVLFAPKKGGNPTWVKGGPCPGRHPGGRKNHKDRINYHFLKAMADDFELHGVSAIEKVRETTPAVYLKIVAGLVPRELKVQEKKVDDLSDEEILSALDKLNTIKSKFASDITTVAEEASQLN